MLAFALIAVTLLAAPSAAGAHTRATLVVTSPQAPPRRPATFQATKILDVEMTAVFARALAGEHVLELKTYTPRGHLYQVLTVPFTGASAKARRPAFRRVRGYPRPLPERVLRRGPAGFLVSAQMPVGGTWIVTNSLYGRWRVDAYLDDDPRPIGRALFTIAP
jgi:hypothetical protein